MSVRPVVGRRRTASPIGRWNVLNNAGKLINIFREYAAHPSTRIRWMAGHGLQIPEPAVVPAGTFVVFMGPPGQLASTDILPHTSPAYKSLRYLRNVFAGRVSEIEPTRLGYWKRHVYGPNDTFPDLRIDMWDYRLETIRLGPSSGSPVARNVEIRHDWPRSSYDRVCGLKDMSTGVKILYKKTRTISQVLASKGPGIYLIMACRASAERVSAGTAMRNYARMQTSGMRAQSRARRVSQRAEPVNVHVQLHENSQGRLATRKRARTSPRRRTPPKTRKTGGSPMDTST
jgi:hypothetical protein